ncbi:MAG: hypothetical protein IJ600_00025 [Lachnospiraceae bacterium]|nr:hypothetical protein [Lachnospiraceae bacterium]
MKWIAVIILLLLAVLWFLARKEAVPAACEASAVTKPFFQMAVYLERKLLQGAEEKKALRRLRELIFHKNEENLRLLDPAGDVKKQLYLQFIQKAGLCFLLLAAGMIFGLLIDYSESRDGLLQEGGILMRKPYGKGHYAVELTAVTNGDAEEIIEVDVQQRAYAEAELKEMLPAFRAALEQTVLGKNESADHVAQDLVLPEELAEYPFSVEWTYDDHTLIGRDGALKEEIPAEGALLNLQAKIRYGTYEEIHRFSLMLYPKAQAAEEGVREKIQAALLQADEDSRTAEAFVLPAEADGIAIVWQERKKSSLAVLVVLVLAAAAAVYWGKDNDLEKRVRERDRQMNDDYPEMVSKLSLYVGAGMTVRLAWKKLAMEYLKKQGKEQEDAEKKRKKNKGKSKRSVYEEMVLTMREMESGVSELQAYQHFAKRCRLQKYVKLVSLLEQNVKLGARGFLDALRKESRDALEERRSRARTLGEEAGTKLLLPMILMLAIVMVVIIVPAFMSI